MGKSVLILSTVNTTTMNKLIILALCSLAVSYSEAATYAEECYCCSSYNSDPRNLDEDEIRSCLNVGASVVAGPSHTWRNSNGEPGVVTEALNNDRRLRVKWQNGVETYYCMGCPGSADKFYIRLDCSVCDAKGNSMFF